MLDVGVNWVIDYKVWSITTLSNCDNSVVKHYNLLISNPNIKYKHYLSFKKKGAPGTVRSVLRRTDQTNTVEQFGKGLASTQVRENTITSFWLPSSFKLNLNSHANQSIQG